jgi:hypothetical protein
MTSNQIEMLIKLNRCSFLPGSFEKRFVKALFNRAAIGDSIKPLTERQGNYLAELFHRYRKQIGHVDHVCFCELCGKAVEQAES